MKRKNFFRLISFGLGLAIVPWSHAQTAAAAGTLQGVVVNAATGNFVQGAAVVLEGANRTELTDSQGKFTFGGVPAGHYRLSVESAGVSRGAAMTDVRAGQIASVTVRMESDVVAMQPLMVTAQAEGQAQSLNLQKTAENMRNVVSEDALANSRLGEVGEALQSIPGVYLEVSTHQPSRAFIRGMTSDLNSVTFDGVRIGTWQGTRDAQVGSFPAENLSRVEVMKTVTPEQEGDAIGGSINLVSKRAFDLPGRMLRIGAGVSYANQQQNWDKQFSVDYGDRFGAKNRMGVFSSFNYYRTDRAYHNVAEAYQVSAADVYNISTQTLLDRIEKGSWKLKYTGSYDLKLSDATTVSVKGLFSDDRRFLADYNSIFRPGTRTAITPDSANSTNGRIDVNRAYREPETINYQISLNLEHARDLWKYDGTLGFNRITNTYSETMTPLMSFNGLNLSYDRSVRDFPTFVVTNGVNLNDPSKLALSTITRSQYDSRNLGYNFSGNARRDVLNLPFKTYLKTGFRVRINDWKQTLDNQGVWNYTGPLSAGQLTAVYYNDRFLRQSGGRVRMPTTLFPDIHKYIDAFYNRPNEFTRQANASELLLARGPKGFVEKVYATYLMANAQFRDLTVIAGARVEKTDLDGWGHQVLTPGGNLTRVTHVTTNNKSTDLLPSVNVIYAFTPQFQLRGAITKTIARPNPQDILPVRTINDTTQVITDGNPDLRVTESINYDLGIAYYLKPLGVLSASAFQKEIDGFYADETETVQTGEYRGYQLTRPGMGTGGRIKGLEVEMQKRLTFLPGLLSGLGVGANHTWLDAKGTYANRPGVTLPFNGVAKRNWNVNVFYARGPVDLRLFVNYRSPYLTGIGTRAALDVYEDSRKTVGFFAKYVVNRRLTLNADVNNISDSAKRSYQGNSSNPTSVRYFDWAVNFRVGLSL
jgi:TonB-dependent receptor